MKTIKALSKLSVLALALAIVSCNKDDDSPAIVLPPAATNQSFISGNVDGSDFSSVIYGNSTAIATSNGTGTSRLIVVTGADLSASSLAIALTGINEVGTYTINSDRDGSYLAYVSSGEDVSYDTTDCGEATGSITITTLSDTMIEGTFHFVGKVDEDCTRTKTVNNGSFKGYFAH